jgi:hypothetical protein
MAVRATTNDDSARQMGTELYEPSTHAGGRFHWCGVLDASAANACVYMQRRSVRIRSQIGK